MPRIFVFLLFLALSTAGFVAPESVNNAYDSPSCDLGLVSGLSLQIAAVQEMCSGTSYTDDGHPQIAVQQGLSNSLTGQPIIETIAWRDLVAAIESQRDLQYISISAGFLPLPMTYILQKWGAEDLCLPKSEIDFDWRTGDSSFETGTAIKIRQDDAWASILPRFNWQRVGKTNVFVHKLNKTRHHSPPSPQDGVEAFQLLYNRFGARGRGSKPLRTDGKFDSKTRAALGSSPREGWSGSLRGICPGRDDQSSGGDYGRYGTAAGVAGGSVAAAGASIGGFFGVRYFKRKRAAGKPADEEQAAAPKPSTPKLSRSAPSTPTGGRRGMGVIQDLKMMGNSPSLV